MWDCSGAAQGREPELRRESEWEHLLAEQITRNGPLFFRLAHGMVRDSRTAEDVFQNALLKAWTHRERLIDANALQSWLRTAVTREALQVCRRKRLEQQAASPGKLPSRKADEPPHHHVDLHDSIAAALEKLPEEVRTVVVLCKIEQVPGKEAARLLGISAVEVSRMLAYGLERLRDHLSDWR
jgi:RNA polymerase sigma-70 factor (ECF subfamily)